MEIAGLNAAVTTGPIAFPFGPGRPRALSGELKIGWRVERYTHSGARCVVPANNETVPFLAECQVLTWVFRRRNVWVRPSVILVSDYFRNALSGVKQRQQTASCFQILISANLSAFLQAVTSLRRVASSCGCDTGPVGGLDSLYFILSPKYSRLQSHARSMILLFVIGGGGG